MEDGNIVEAEIVENEISNSDEINNHNDNCVEENYHEGIDFDWDNFWYYTQRTINILSIIVAFIGVLAILSYPLVHVVNTFFHIDSFIKNLPVGYLSSVSIPDFKPAEPITMFIFGFVCLMIGAKLCNWLVQYYSIGSRITCILMGSLFMYFMISQKANNMLIHGLEAVSILVIFILFIPIFEAILWMGTPLHNFLPEPERFFKSYYGRLFGMFIKNNNL